MQTFAQSLPDLLDPGFDASLFKIYNNSNIVHCTIKTMKATITHMYGHSYCMFLWLCDLRSAIKC